MKINKTSLSIIASALTLSILTGCDGGSSANGNNSVSSVNGTAVDGYIVNGQVCLDLNNDNICSKDEPQTMTDSKGKYKLDISKVTEAEKEKAKLIVIGGIDNSSGKPFIGLLKSPLLPDTKEIFINPITTLVAAKIVNNSNANVEMQKVATSLGIKEKDINTDHLKNKNTKVYEKSLQIQKSIEMFTAATNDGKINRENIQKITEQLSKQLKGEHAEELTNIINNTVFDNGLEEANKIKVSVNDVVSNININSNSNYNDMVKEGAKTDALRDIIINKIKTSKINNKNLSDTFNNFSISNDINKIDMDFESEGYLLRLLDLIKVDNKEEIIDSLRDLDLSYNTTLPELLEKVENSSMFEGKKYDLISKIKVAMLITQTDAKTIKNFNPSNKSFYSINNFNENDLDLKKITFTDKTLNKKSFKFNLKDKTFNKYNNIPDNAYSFNQKTKQWMPFNPEADISWNVDKSNDNIHLSSAYGDTNFKFVAINDLSNKTKDINIGYQTISVNFPKGSTEYVTENELDNVNHIIQGLKSPFSSLEKVFGEPVNVINIPGLEFTFNGELIDNSGSITINNKGVVTNIGTWVLSEFNGNRKIDINIKTDLPMLLLVSSQGNLFISENNNNEVIFAMDKKIKVDKSDLEHVYNQTAIEAIKTALLLKITKSL